MSHSVRERLRDIARVNMMERLPSNVRQSDFVPIRQIGENLGIEISRRIQGRPPNSHQMPGM